jgi:hypothetical protein
MISQKSGVERAVVLVKALPQPSEKYLETVCVAGLTATGEWRRLYPVRFRQLDNRFKRWQWVEYNWQTPRADRDRRSESRNVDNESLKSLSVIKQSERARFLGPRIRASTAEATARKETLALIRPSETRFSWERKSAAEIAAERGAYARAAQQTSLLDGELKALEPCPFKFHFQYKTADGKFHRGLCHDWETSAAFNLLSKKYGTDGALAHLNKEYNERYPKAGMAFAMGTHSQHPDQWLLIGVIRLDEEAQVGLAV